MARVGLGAVLVWLEDWFTDYQYGPTYRDMVNGLQLSGPAQARNLILRLHQRGDVEFTVLPQRCFRLTQQGHVRAIMAKYGQWDDESLAKSYA